MSAIKLADAARHGPLGHLKASLHLGGGHALLEVDVPGLGDVFAGGSYREGAAPGRRGACLSCRSKRAAFVFGEACGYSVAERVESEL
ncbi:MAG: hypothetical protein ACREQ5_12650, partial [Candidatus Dormibacteria bacterium]